MTSSSVKTESKVDMARKLMTRVIPTESELINFIKLHLETLYQSYYEAEKEEDYSLMDYCQGSIDTTQVYLIKCGVEPMEYEEFVKIADSEWERD
jgi:hypothetical protein